MRTAFLVVGVVFLACNPPEAGPAGPQGPGGAEGPQGPAGNSLLVKHVTSGDSNCPAGGVELDDGSGVVGFVCNGTPGEAGEPGAVGPAGAAGPAGPAGIPGLAGPVGPVGPVGPAGPQGATGSQGPVGPAGPQGPMGLRGPTGATGPQGIPGVSSLVVYLSQSLINSQAFHSAVVNCPSGKKIVGGGARVRDFTGSSNVPGAALTASYPTNGVNWNAEARGPTTTAWGVEAYALCAVVP